MLITIEEGVLNRERLRAKAAVNLLKLLINDDTLGDHVKGLLSVDKLYIDEDERSEEIEARLRLLSQLGI